MSKLFKIKEALDYYLFSNRLRRIVVDVLTEISSKEGLLIGVNKDSALLYQQGGRFAFQYDWSNHWSTNISVTVYCLLADVDIQNIEYVNNGENVSQHQPETRVLPMSWVWLPRLDLSLPTSYYLKYSLSKKQFRLKLTRVGRGTDSDSVVYLTQGDIKSDLVEIFSGGIKLYKNLLSAAVKRDKRQFKVGDRVRLLAKWGLEFEEGDQATVRSALSADYLEVTFDNQPDKPFTIWQAYVDFTN